MTPATVASYRSSLRDFARFLGGRSITDFQEIDRDAIRDYIQLMRKDRKLRLATVENHLSCITSFLEYLEYEGEIESNPAPAVRKRYLRQYKAEVPDAESRRLITIEQLRQLVDAIMIPRDRALIMLLAKTGIRRGELVGIDLADVDLVALRIKLKPKAKRSNRVVFFDQECARVLQDWLSVRKRYARDCPALFITETGGRLDRSGVYLVVTKHAQRVGLHDATSERLEDHFTPHCLRHWFTTYLRRNGMPREMIQELRGDIRREAIDVYYHIDAEQLRTAYLRYMPKLGVR